MSRKGRAIAAAFVAGAMMLAGGGIAYADTLDVSDELIAGQSSNLKFGPVECDDDVHATIDLALKRQGNTPGGSGTTSPVFANNTVVSITKSAQTGNLTATDPSPATITTPFDWGNADPNDLTEASNSTISVDTSTNGDFSATVTYTASGANTKGGTRTDDVVVTVSWLVSGCVETPADSTAPVVTLVCPTEPVLLHAVAEATWTATDEDGGSGLDPAFPSSGSVPLDTSSVGTHTATVAAGTVQDNAGNVSAEATCLYSVIYDFDGFFSPVDMGDTVNSVKAGSAVPVKFSLAGDQGLGIIVSGYPTVSRYACGAIADVDAIEETVNAGGSSLSYDPIADQYVYVWKTDKTWAGTCGTFILKLDDGTVHTADFQFKK